MSSTRLLYDGANTESTTQLLLSASCWGVPIVVSYVFPREANEANEGANTN